MTVKQLLPAIAIIAIAYPGTTRWQCTKTLTLDVTVVEAAGAHKLCGGNLKILLYIMKESRSEDSVIYYEREQI